MVHTHRGTLNHNRIRMCFPVAGLGLGSLSSLRRVFDPSLQFSQSGQTGIAAAQILSVSSIGGGVDLAKSWRRYHATVVYSGAETIYQPPTSELNTCLIIV